MSWKIIRLLCVPAFALLLTLKIYIWANNFIEKEFGSGHDVKSSGEAVIGGSFMLVNQDSRMVADSDFKGKLMLIYFGFTSCPDTCPADLALITNVMNQLGDDAKKVQPIFITVDPIRDVPQQLKKYLSNFYPGIIGLTGASSQIDDVTRKYHILSQKVGTEAGGHDDHEHGHDHDDYRVEHSSYIYLMGKDGKYITHFSDKQGVDEILGKIKVNL